MEHYSVDNFRQACYTESMPLSIRETLRELGLNPSEVKVYIALTLLGEAPASRIAKKVDMPRTTVISVLEKLHAQDLLSTHKYRGVTTYWIESPMVFREMLLAKAKIAEVLGRELSDLYRTESKFPFAEIYDAKASIRKFIERTIAGLKQGSVICTIDVPNEGNYAKIFSDTTERVMHTQKRARGVLTKTLVPHGALQRIPKEKTSVQNIEIHELPVGVTFDASIWIIGDLVVHFSGNPPFVVAFRHEKMAKGMQSLFDHFWGGKKEE